MTDERPKPKYGELAPEGWVWKPPADPAHDEAPDATAQPAASGPSSWPAPRTPPLSDSAAPPTPGARPGQADRIATVILLTLGVLGTINMVTSMLALPDVMQEAMRIYGVSGVYSAGDTARAAGFVGAFLIVPIYLATVLISLRRLRAGRMAFFVPLIGAVAAFTVNLVVVIVALQADPAILDAISTTSL